MKMKDALIKGKDKLFHYFKNNLNAFWSISSKEDTKSIIASNFIERNMTKSESMLQDCIDNLNPDHVYVLSTWKIKEAEMNYRKPDTSITFTLSDNIKSVEEPISGTSKREDFYDSESFKKSIHLIEENTKLQVENASLKRLIEEKSLVISELNKIIEEYELQETEEEVDEEEEEKISGTPLERALADILKEKGGFVIESISSLLQNKFAKKQEPMQETTINGINTSEEIPTMDEIVNTLLEHDPNLHLHLFKLTLIAKEKPDTFKFLINSINAM